jgi:hypothetical protein
VNGINSDQCPICEKDRETLDNVLSLEVIESTLVVIEGEYIRINEIVKLEIIRSKF